MKFKHDKARGIYEKCDPQKEYYNMIKEAINGDLALHDGALNVGQEIAQSNNLSKNDNLKNTIITAAEAIYEAVNNHDIGENMYKYYLDCGDDRWIDRDDKVFDIIISNLIYPLNNSQYSQIIGYLQETYDVEL